eukprot:2847816-Amphidinium_carterae.1
MRASKPARAVEALQRAILRYPGSAVHPTYIGNLGTAYGALGNASKMRDYVERALQIQEAHYGPDHLEVTKTLNNLG